MPHATGTRLAAAFFTAISFAPPWIHAIITLPIGIGLWWQARQKEKESKQQQAALEQLANEQENT